VLQRDGYTCQLAYPGICTGRATDFDHVVPLGENGADTDENTVASCRSCHLRRASYEGHRARGHNVPTLPTPHSRPSKPQPKAEVPRTIWIR
jgi:5-methylcytosine-specific restriction endonuclease McrA